MSFRPCISACVRTCFYSSVCVCLSACPSNCLSVRPSVHLCASVRASVRPLCLSVYMYSIVTVVDAAPTLIIEMHKKWRQNVRLSFEKRFIFLTCFCLSVYLSAYLSVCQSVCLCASIRPCVHLTSCRPACLPACLSVCLSFHPYVRPYVRLTVCQSVHPFVQTHRSVRPSVRLFVCPSMRMCVRLSVRSYVGLSVYIYSIVAAVDDVFSSSLPKIVLIKPFGCRMKTFHIRPSFEINVSPICNALFFATNNERLRY